jgi:hypothetical protein
MKKERFNVKHEGVIGVCLKQAKGSAEDQQQPKVKEGQVRHTSK